MKLLHGAVVVHGLIPLQWVYKFLLPLELRGRCTRAFCCLIKSKGRKMSLRRLSKAHAGRFKNTTWQDSISGMFLLHGEQRWRCSAAAEDEVWEKQLLWRVKDWRWSSIPACHCFRITLLEFLVESGAKMEMKNHVYTYIYVCAMKKRAKDPMRLVIRRQSRINGRFVDKPRKTFSLAARAVFSDFLWIGVRQNMFV